MTCLFIDSTYDITLGILDDDLGWKDFKQFKGQKASVVLQTEAFKLFNSFNIRPQDISAIITVAGPGFYTGLRLSEGFADVFQFFKIPFYSFYTFEIPLWCGFHKGVWMTKAYKGEYFFHYWNGEERKDILVSTKELSSYVSAIDNKIFIHSEDALDKFSLDLIEGPVRTLDLLKDHSKIIFKQILENKIKKESFYFRAPEDEFKVST